MDLLLSFLFGLIGVAYLVYGKKQSDLAFMLAGGLLCIYPYLVTDIAAMLAIGVLLSGAPFVARHFGW